jgi:hypothetical protein
LIHFPSFVACSPSHKIAINKGEAAGGRRYLLFGGGLDRRTSFSTLFQGLRRRRLGRNLDLSGFYHDFLFPHLFLLLFDYV